MTRYGFFKEMAIPFDTVLKKLPMELRRKGFEVLSDVRVDRELEKYLGVNFQRYAILGVCNLALAFKALSKQEDSGLVILNNIIVYEKENSTAVGLLKPTHYMTMIQNESIINDAATIERKLYEVLDSLSRKKTAKQNSFSAPFQRAVA
ncbi:MAG TPA: DUF302 domain-containing protein [Chitinispirillaceae bacterium]|jgi:uncharacterized protein (DUF302 family)|nr:DUF302 domain-containing protein [Chitinispirillaceae bacterium]